MKNTISGLRNTQIADIEDALRKADIIVISKKTNKRSAKVNDIIAGLQMDLNHSIFRDEEIDNIDRRFAEISEHAVNCNVVLDISCIPGDTMATLFHLFAKYSSKTTVNVSVIYCLAKYIDPKPDLSPNETVAPAHPRFAGWLAKPKFPILTIVGLGYEKDKALGAIEYLDASRTFLFIPTSCEERYQEKVTEQNHDLLLTTEKNQKFEYDVHDPAATIHMLNSILVAAKSDSKPVLLPFGPKIFFSAALVAALIHPEASVWYVSGEKKDALHDEQDVSAVFGYEFTLDMLKKIRES